MQNKSSFKNKRPNQGNKGGNQGSAPGKNTKNQSSNNNQGPQNDTGENILMAGMSSKPDPQQKQDSKANKPSKSQKFAEMQDTAIISIEQPAEDSKKSGKPMKFTNTRLKNREAQEGKLQQQSSEGGKSSMNADAMYDGFGGSSKASAGKGQRERENNSRRELEKTAWLDNDTTQNTRNANRMMRGKALDEADDGSQYDQFAGRNTTYSENLYSNVHVPALDKLSKPQLELAERVSREILNKDAEGNKHLAEERGQIMQRDGEDEELQYSGVPRNVGGHAKNRKQSKSQFPALKNHKRFTCLHKVSGSLPSFTRLLDEKVEAVKIRRLQGLESGNGITSDNQWDPVPGDSGHDQKQNKINSNTISAAAQLQDQSHPQHTNPGTYKPRKGSGQHFNQGSYYGKHQNYQQNYNQNNYGYNGRYQHNNQHHPYSNNQYQQDNYKQSDQYQGANQSNQTIQQNQQALPQNSAVQQQQQPFTPSTTTTSSSQPTTAFQTSAKPFIFKPPAKLSEDTREFVPPNQQTQQQNTYSQNQSAQQQQTSYSKNDTNMKMQNQQQTQSTQVNNSNTSGTQQQQNQKIWQPKPQQQNTPQPNASFPGPQNQGAQQQRPQSQWNNNNYGQQYNTGGNQYGGYGQGQQVNTMGGFHSQQYNNNNSFRGGQQQQWGNQQYGQMQASGNNFYQNYASGGMGAGSQPQPYHQVQQSSDTSNNFAMQQQNNSQQMANTSGVGTSTPSTSTSQKLNITASSFVPNAQKQ